MKINTIFDYWQFLKIKNNRAELKIGQNSISKKIRKTDMAVRYTGNTDVVRVYFVHSIFNCIFGLKIDFYSSFQFNSISNFLMRFWILKHKSFMEIQFLKWKSEIPFSIFNFWKQKFFSWNPVSNKKFEIQFTLNLKNKFPSENT